jgi:hypothetical protein
MIVAIMVVAATAAAVTAWITDVAAFAWAALAVAAVVMVLMIVRIVRDRRAPADEADTSAPPAAPETSEASEASEADVATAGSTTDHDVESGTTEPEPQPAAASAPVGSPEPDGGEDGPDGPLAVEGAGSDVVYVLPGRRRFHRAGCELIVDRATDDISLDDARDEGFSACSRCHQVAASS